MRTPAAGMPTRCAPGTGVLYKATVNHADGKHLEMPLMDCVLDMRVVVAAEVPPPGTTIRTGTANAAWRAIPPPALGAAQQVRDQAIDVRVYIVAQEGQERHFVYLCESESTCRAASVYGCEYGMY